MQTNSINPFAQSDLRKINELLQSCADTKCVIDKLKSLGLSVEELENYNDSHHQFAKNAKLHFFPHEE